MARPNNASSVLIRQEWTDAVVVGSEKESYFGPYMNGKGKMNGAPIVYQAKSRELNGHLVNFPGVGDLTDAVIANDATGIGKGEKLRVFSSQLRANRFRKVTQTDTAYDRQGIGLESYLNEQGLKAQLTSFYARWYDQYIFDCLQGVAQRTLGSSNEGRATHVVRYPYANSAASFTYKNFQNLQRIAAEGNGFTQGGRRKPLSKAKMSGGHMKWLLIIDPSIREVMLGDDSKGGWQEVLGRADNRGMENNLLSPVFTSLNSIAIVEAPRYFGATSATTGVGYHSGAGDATKTGFARDQVGVESCGLRQYDDNSFWTGQSGFDDSGELWSRAVLVGMHAVQVGYSMRPKMGVETNEIDDLTTLSLAVHMGAQKTKWDPEARGDYDDGPVTNLDYAAVAVDIQVGA